VQTYSGQKAPDTAFLIELVGGFFGLLGLGYMYVGRTNDGVIRLVIWLLYDIIAACVITTLSFAVVGLVCIPFQLAIQIIVPIWSANKLKTELLGGIQP
jgi:TM2 domain-containing membrane protein YozV